MYILFSNSANSVCCEKRLLYRTNLVLSLEEVHSKISSDRVAQIVIYIVFFIKSEEINTKMTQISRRIGNQNKVTNGIPHSSRQKTTLFTLTCLSCMEWLIKVE